jgi:plasmid stabilization system protein ParE
VIFDRLAMDEAAAAHAWYSERNPYAAELFLEDLDMSIARVQEAPEVWPRYRQKWRRFVFRRFPFNLVYLVRSDHIQVVAVAHQKRRPLYWSER